MLGFSFLLAAQAALPTVLPTAAPAAPFGPVASYLIAACQLDYWGMSEAVLLIQAADAGTGRNCRAALGCPGLAPGMNLWFGVIERLSGVGP